MLYYTRILIMMRWNLWNINDNFISQIRALWDETIVLIVLTIQIKWVIVNF